MTFADAGLHYIQRRHLHNNEINMLERLLQEFGDRTLSSITASDWTSFVATTLPGRKPSTIDRYLSVFRGVFAEGEGEGIEAPQIRSPRTSAVMRRARRVRWLSQDEAEALHRAYSPAAQRVVTVLRYQGMRAQEAMQLDRRQILEGEGPSGSIYIPESKNGLARTIAMHPKVRELTLELLEEDRQIYERPNGTPFEPLFLSSRGEPYRDTRATSGGSPLKRAHTTALRRSGVTNFTIHDWRRHWACWQIKSGTDVFTLMKMGGWESAKSLEPYVAAVSSDLSRQAELLARTP